MIRYLNTAASAGLAVVVSLAGCTNILGKFQSSNAGAGGTEAAASTTDGAGGAGPSSSSSSSTDASASSSATGMPPLKRVFVTAAQYNGGFGFSNGNALCQKAADGAKLGGKYAAWLATGGVPAACKGGPFYLADGKTFVGSCDDLFAGQLKHPIDEVETGLPPNGGTASVWTGAKPNGNGTGKDCMGWTSLPPDGTIGSIKDGGFGWSTAATQPCDVSARLYCLEL